MPFSRFVLAAALLLVPAAAVAADGIWVEPRPGCKVWLAFTKADDLGFEWFGQCRDGYAHGNGTLNFF